MRGVHVLAHPQARVGDAHARRRGPAGDPLDARARPRAGSSSCSTPSGGGSARSPRRDQPRFDERVVVVAGDDHQLAPRERRAEVLEERARGGHRVAQRPVAQLEHVAEQHHPVDVRERRQQRRAQLGAAQQVRAASALPRCRSETISVRMARGSPLGAVARAAPAPAAGPAPRSGGRRLARRATASRICLGSMKRTSSRTTSNSEMSLTPRARKKSTSSLHEVLGRARARGDAHHAPALQPLLLHLARVVDQVRLGAAVARDLDQPHRVGGVARADHEHQVAAAGHLLDGRLAVGGGVADVVGARARRCSGSARAGAR